ncbi:MAG: hypothetical protein IT529_16540 [Burkholderiales bacterium]|nr:hypothetical protein [Burkholderiales bacterium]
MKAVKASVLSVIALVGFALAAEAFAHGRGYYYPRHRSSVSIGIGVGVPGYWYGAPYYRPYYRPYYGYPYYGYPYYAPAVVVPSAPPVYIEQGQPAPSAAAPAAPSEAYWYFCAESHAYYPYVKECAGPWQRVSPLPPPS